MKKCDCYCTEEQIIGWHTLVDPKTTIVHKCNGTREREECSCGGDRTKCDFYPEVREKALPKFGEWISVKDRLPKDMQQCLIYATIYFTPDHIDDCDHYNSIEVARFYKEFGFIGNLNACTKFWMPLPSPPTEKEN